LIVVGSSLVVQPAATLPLAAKRSGARLVIINRDPTPYDDLAELVIPGSAGEILPAIVEGVKAGIKGEA
jgi:NAD-dependent deacetylase